ncbi:PREDICTED: separin [Nanorana parkeri]|uniref:separin n=1 Tax=Nanorana parkeri TaxID=125878 RepID=UPI00085447E2|nr:PREDICTED: separin [Nanorana parkeri]
MKALKGADFIKLTSSTESVIKLQTELKSCLSDVPSDPSKPDQLSDQRVVCDRVLRACNHWVAESSCLGPHLSSLMPLAELASRGFHVSGAQRTPFYLEKIQFHLLKNVSTRESSYKPCIQLSDLLYSYLSRCPPELQNNGEYLAVAKSSFQCLWKAVIEQEQKRGPCPFNREALSLRLHALRFLMLVEKTNSHAGSPITTHQHAKCAIVAFESKSMLCSQSDACFLSQSIEELLVKPLKGSGTLTHSWAKCLLELTVERIRVLCKGSCFDQSKEVVQQAIASLNASDRCCLSGFKLLKFSIEIQESKKPREVEKRLVEIAEDVGEACGSGEGWQCQALCTCCQFTVSSLDGYFKHVGHSETQGARRLLSLRKFLDMHFKLLDKQVSMVCMLSTIETRYRTTFELSCSQQFTNVACSFLQSSKVRQEDGLCSIVDACKDTVCKMLASVNGLSGQDAAEFLNITASCVHNLAYWFYSQKKYKEASDLVSPLCEYLAAARPEGEPELAVERLHRCFKLHVESYRKAGYTALGLTAVTLWLRALQGHVLQQMAEPVAVWVRLKIDGAKNGDEDLRLQTLKDGFSDHPVDPELMVSLLAEELKGYKSVHGDTGQERYNTICDLLELCAENSQLHHHRAPFLLELAQVLCYHDYSGQTECTALDAVQDCLRLLESVPESTENREQWLDVKAQALLWQYICTLEANMREVLEEQQRKENLNSQKKWTGVEYEPNDLNYEDKLHDDQSAKDGICFTLAGEAGPMKGLDEALDLWKDILSGTSIPSLNNNEHTVFSLHLLGSLFRLMGKPLQAVQSFQLVRHLCGSWGDFIREVGALCHLTRLMFYLESTECAQVTLQEAETALEHADRTSEAYILASCSCELLRSHLFRINNQVKNGVEVLTSLLQHPSLQKSSKAWYLLKVQVLQELSAYLRLPPAMLLPDLYKKLCAQGWHNPETALTEAHKLLRSIVLLLVGNDVLSAPKSTTEMRFVDYGENLLQKWQVLADLLSCSQDLISTLSSLGSVSEAKSFCLEGLRLAKTLHSMRHCADFLLRKAELETLRAEPQLCEEDLQYVVFLMESCTDFTANTKQKEVKVKVSKGKKSNKKEKTPDFTPSPPAEADDFLKRVQFQFVETRDLVKPPESPTIAAPSEKTLPDFVSHTLECTCPLCSDLVLALLCTQWLVAKAENEPQSKDLLHLALKRSQFKTHYFSEVLKDILHVKDCKSISLGINDWLIARIYQSVVYTSPPPNLAEGILEEGLDFVSSRPASFSKQWKASLLLAKALDSVYKLSLKHGGCIADLFMQVWGWKPHIAKRVADLSSKSNQICNSAISNKKKGAQKLSVASLHDLFSPDESEPCLPFVSMKTPTILQKDLLTTQTKPVAPAVGRKCSVSVYDEDSPKRELEPRAPRRRKTRAVIKVDFSDSDLEIPDNLDTDPTWNSKKQAVQAKPTSRRRPSTKSCTLLAPSESDDEEVTAKNRSRRGRGSAKKAPKESSTPEMHRRRPQGKLDIPPVDALRSIEEEPEWLLDLSIDELRASDAEDQKPTRAPGRIRKPSKKEKIGECEILRRDVGSEIQGWTSVKEQEGDPNIFSMKGVSSSLPAIFSASDLEPVSSYLKEALESVAHFPPCALYAKLCRLRALCSGGQDPYMTAFLINESVAITLRHQLLSDVHRKLRKLKKEGSGDVSDKLQSLSLDDHQDPQIKYLSQLEALFQFPKQSIKMHSFKDQLQEIPTNTAVCILTLADIHQRSPGDTLLLCRLEKGNSPVTVHIPTSQLKMSLSTVLQEFADIQKQQKIVNNLTDKREWWEGRTALDGRMKALIQSLEEQVLGCWKVLLSPPCSAPALEEEARVLSKALVVCGWRRADPGLLKAILQGCHHLTAQQIQFIAQGFSAPRPEQAQELLNKSIDKLKSKTEHKEGHLILVLDKHLQQLPWECMPCLLTRSVTRLPSLHFLLNYNLLRKHQPQSSLVRGVDPKKTFYVLNPHSNLPGTEERFRDWFKNEPGWTGVVRSSPKSEDLQTALTKQDLYIYVGHGAGAHFLDAQTLQRLDCNAVVLLFGCSSAALAVRRDLEGAGLVLKYLMAGCPMVVGNLWDVTDREIDRYTVAFLQGWLKAGPGATLLKYLSESRQAPKLKHIIGAAPVAYGIPVALQ